VNNATFYTYGNGLNLGSGGVAGHLYTNFRAVNCKYGIYAVFSANQGIQMNNWMVDNGNIIISGSIPVYLQGTSGGINACIFVSGVILQATPGRVATLPSLPSLSYPLGSWVYLTTNSTYYQNDSNAWVSTAFTTDNYAIQLYGMENVRLSNIDFTSCEAWDSCIYISNTSSYNLVGGCSSGGQLLVHCDNSSGYNRALGNVIGVTFSPGTSGTNQLSS
jgi:hypothetical protein